MMSKAPSLNQFWSDLIIEELIRNGVDYFCLSPGSRSAPLAIAVAQNPRAKSLVHFDERGMAFHALGYVSATGKACALITTSGTAVANVFPAVVEASKKKLPLIILTADRPPELRACGAHQAIDQVKIFGEYVRWFFDLPCPTSDIPTAFVLTTVDQAVFRTHGEIRGPVHVNCMFREPLFENAGNGFKPFPAELKHWQNSGVTYTSYANAQKKLDEDVIDTIARQIHGIKRGIIVAGKLSAVKEQESVLRLAQRLNWPVFPDVSSGLRLGCTHKNVIHYFDQVLLGGDRSRPVPTGVIHLGGRMTSKRWQDYVEQSKPSPYIMVLNHPLRNDPWHGVTLRVHACVEDFCNALAKKATQGKVNPFLASLHKKNAKIDRIVEEYLGKEPQWGEAAAARLVTQYIPADNGLFLANSLPLREVDSYGDPKGKAVVVGANRGASGIDGIVASACGFTVGLKRPVTLLIGDLALLHDLNSLVMLKNAPHPLVIVTFNNDGGGIFNFLPIAQFKNGFEKFFAAPHGLNFEAAAQMFGLNYSRPATKEGFVRTYKIALESKASTLIEITSDRKQNAAVIQGLQGKIRKVTAPSFRLRRKS